MSFGNDLTDQYLDKLYDDLQKEQQRILQDIKTGCEATKEADNQKQFNLINTIMLNTMKLRNLKRKIKAKLDS